MIAGRNVITFSPYEVYHITIFSHYSHLVSNRDVSTTHRSSQLSGYVLDLLSETISQNSFVMLEVYIHL